VIHDPELAQTAEKQKWITVAQFYSFCTGKHDVEKLHPQPNAVLKRNDVGIVQ